MREKLTSLLILEGFTAVDSNIPEFKVYIKREFSHVNIIFALDLTRIGTCTVEQYDTLQSSSLELLKKQGIRHEMHYLTICLAGNTERALALCAHDKRAWVIDVEARRLLIEEGKLEDFYGMKQKLQVFLENPDAAMEEITQLENLIRKEIEKKEKSAKPPVSYVTLVIIGINVIVFLLDLYSGNYLWEQGALSLHVLQNAQWYRLLTSAFLHADIYHLLNNMLIVYAVGSVLENVIGRVSYAVFYVLAIVASGLSFICYSMFSQDYVMTIGASGAAYALLGAMTVLLLSQPLRQIRNMLPRLLILLACVIIGITQDLQNPMVNAVSHIGGICFGAIVMLLFILVKRIREEGKSHEN